MMPNCNNILNLINKCISNRPLTNAVMMTLYHTYLTQSFKVITLYQTMELLPYACYTDLVINTLKHQQVQI